MLVVQQLEARRADARQLGGPRHEALSLHVSASVSGDGITVVVPAAGGWGA